METALIAVVCFVLGMVAATVFWVRHLKTVVKMERELLPPELPHETTLEDLRDDVEIAKLQAVLASGQKPDGVP